MSKLPRSSDFQSAAATSRASPNARSKSVTTAPGPDTFGTLNQHAQHNTHFQVGVHEDRGLRRTMEDAYSFIVDFAGVRGQGYFAVFDGHAGKHAAEWCGGHFHEHLLDSLSAQSNAPIPDILNKTFHNVDLVLSNFAANDDKMHSGCTAVTAFLRIEDVRGGQSFLPESFTYPTKNPALASNASLDETASGSGSSARDSGTESTQNGEVTGAKRSKKSGSRIIKALKSFSGSTAMSTHTEAGSSISRSDSPKPMHNQNASLASSVVGAPSPAPMVQPPFEPTPDLHLRRVLYTANAGDARAVLCRGGKAIRLTYDHKGSDKQEAKRITDAGGFVMSGRVNGVLAVTRALGDSSMKEFVVGSPYTTETELGEKDEFLILACDGVWDVTTDQEAVDLVRDELDPQKASKKLVEHALKESTDNITVLVIRLGPGADAGSASTR